MRLIIGIVNCLVLHKVRISLWTIFELLGMFHNILFQGFQRSKGSLKQVVLQFCGVFVLEVLAWASFFRMRNGLLWQRFAIFLNARPEYHGHGGRGVLWSLLTSLSQYIVWVSTVNIALFGKGWLIIFAPKSLPDGNDPLTCSLIFNLLLYFSEG